jgi:uncharacterized protein
VSPFRRRLASFAAGLLAACALASASAAEVPVLKARVTDQTGTLTAEQVAALEARSAGVETRKGAQLVVLVVSSTAPDAVEEYALKVAEQNKIGRKGTDDGVLLVIAKDDRKARVEVGYGLEGAIPDISASRIIREYLAPHFRKNDYYGGIDEATQALAKLIDGEPLPPPLEQEHASRGSGTPGSGLVLGLLLGMLANVVLRWMPGLLRALGAGALGAWLGALMFGLGLTAFVMAASAAFFSAANPGTRRWTSGGGIGGGFGGWGGGSGGGGGGGWSGGGGGFGGGGASGGW